MYLKLRKYYQIEYHLYCLNFAKYCIFYIKDTTNTLPNKNIFIKSKLPCNSVNIKTIYSSYNFNLLYFQYFKDFQIFFYKNMEDIYFVKIDKYILTKKQTKNYFLDLIKRPTFILILKPIISILKILNYLQKCQH